MKYLNIILTIIVIFLLSITLKLINISAQLSVSNRNNQLTINSNQELITSNHRLEKYFSELMEEIGKLNNTFLSKENKGVGNEK